MQQNTHFKNSRSHRQGFALIATISVMVLLVLVALAMLGLSTIELRAVNASSAREEARSNARMALMLALGELQKLSGPDTRVTASAATLTPEKNETSIIDSNLPRIAGVWKSWENMDWVDDMPSKPDYSLKEVSGDTSLTNPSEGRFLAWLISNSGGPLTDPLTLPDVTKNSTSVPLLASGTLGDNAVSSEIHIVPTAVTNTTNRGASQKGSYAWWVSPNNSKADLSPPDRERNSTLDWRQAMANHSIADAQSLGIDLTPEERTENTPKIITRQSLDLAANDPGISGANYHHLTHHARGLLTNVNKGGWKKDLSLLSESYNQSSGSYSSNVAGAPELDSCIYSWFQPVASGLSWYKIAPVKTWAGLMDYAVQYSQVARASASGDASFDPKLVAPVWKEGNKGSVTRMPVIADIRFVLAYSAKPRLSGANMIGYTPAMTINPVFTVWNPWNYKMPLNGLSFRCSNIPFTFKWKVGSDTYEVPFANMISRKASDATLGQLFAIKFADCVLGPGETKIFSPESDEFVDHTNHSSLVLRELTVAPGYRTRGGLRYEIPNPDKNFKSSIRASLTDKVSVEVDVTTITLNQGGGLGTSTGLNFVVYWGGTSGNRGDDASVQRMLLKKSVADQYFKPLKNLPSVSLSNAATSNEIFASCFYTLRTANDTEFRSRGAFQANPNTLYGELGVKSFVDAGKDVSKGNYPGSMHPVNAPYEVHFLSHSGWNDTRVPNEGSNQRGYVVTGLDAATGVERCVTNEIPLRPLSSIVELQHFQVRGQNQYPPFRNNIIGNSVAYPLVPADSVEVPLPSSADENNSAKKQWDDSYCMNRLLFDDWFVSSITPQTRDWSGQDEASIEQVYTDHVSGDTPLANIQYLPATIANRANPEKDLNQLDSWQTIASRLVVKGMFNVNSTSVEAWKSLLSHARDHEVAHLDGSANSGDATSSGGEGHPVSRTTVAGTLCSDSDLVGYERLIGYRRLTDVQIEALAVAIVKQIRKRGPALSLAEFANRQLKSGSELALAGTVQAALDELASLGSDSRNPFADLQDLCEPAEVFAGADYLHPEAAKGWTGEGLPGWITQADILRPLAPVISVRDDTFTIRAYGDARDAKGKIIARAWCEAVIERRPEYIAPDSSLDATSDDNTKNGVNKEINQLFGRRFTIVSFKWLSPEQI